MIVIVGFLSFAMSFGILYLSRTYLTRHKLYRGDAFFHLLVSESIRKHRWKLPQSLENVTFSEIDKNYNYLAYPPLYHYIISLFPIKFHIRIAENFNTVILSLTSSLTAILVYGITSSLGLAVLSSFITVFNLSVFDLVIHLSPRSLGLFFYSLVVCITVFCPENLYSLLVIAFLVGLISLTHKFAFQALIFGFLPYIVIFSRPYVLLSLTLGLFLSILVSRGFYLRILKEHISWLRFYMHRHYKSNTITNLTTIFGRNVWVLQIVILFFFMLLQSGGVLIENLTRTDLLTKVFFWVFINILLALIVTLPSFSFLGEYYRYVEYSIVPVGIAATLLMANSSPFILFVSLVSVSISLLTLMKFRNHLVYSGALVDKDDISSYRSIRDYNLNNLLVIPGNRSLEVNYYSMLGVIHPVRGAKTSFEQFTNLINKYEIRYVLKFKLDDQFQAFTTLANMISMKKIADFKNFELYKITQKKGYGVSTSNSGFATN